MAKTWTNIASTDIDAESFVTETLLGQFHDNQEALISQPVDTRFSQANTTGSPASYAEIARVPVYIVPAANTSAGDVDLIVRLEAWADAGSTTIDVRVQLSGGTWVEVTGITATSPTFQTFTLPSTDVKAAADTEIDMIVQARVTAGAGEAVARCRSSSSRLARAA